MERKKTWRGKYIVRCTASDTETSILWWSNLQPLCKLRAKIALFTKRRLLLVKWKKNTEKMQLMKWNCGWYLDSDQHQIATKVNIFFSVIWKCSSGCISVEIAIKYKTRRLAKLFKLFEMSAIFCPLFTYCLCTALTLCLTLLALSSIRMSLSRSRTRSFH